VQYLPRISIERIDRRLPVAQDGTSAVVLAPITQAGHEHDLAITISYSDASSGEIIEADIVLNAEYPWNVIDPNAMGSFDIGESCSDGGMSSTCPAGYDVQDVVTHEAGHFFGLGEDYDEPAATMFHCTSRCETHKRVLKSSDSITMDSLYPEPLTEKSETKAEANWGCSVAALR
jgi:hypothetical protein